MLTCRFYYLLMVRLAVFNLNASWVVYSRVIYLTHNKRVVSCVSVTLGGNSNKQNHSLLYMSQLTYPLLSCLGKNQESWALDLEVEDLKLLCPDGTDAGLDEYERCHLAAVPANAVVVRMEDKCRVWKYLERVQVGVDINCIWVCVCWMCGVGAMDLCISVHR